MKLFFIRRDTTHRCADGSKQRIGESRKDRTLTGGGSLLVKLEHNNDNLLNILSLLACLRGHLPHTPDRHHRTIIVRTSMFRTTWRQKVTFVPRKTGICRHTQGRVEGSSFSHSIDWCDHVCCNPAGDGEKEKKEKHEMRPKTTTTRSSPATPKQNSSWKLENLFHSSPWKEARTWQMSCNAC